LLVCEEPGSHWALCRFIEKASKGLLSLDGDDLGGDNPSSLGDRLATIEERLNQLEGK